MLYYIYFTSIIFTDLTVPTETSAAGTLVLPCSGVIVTLCIVAAVGIRLTLA
jgi:hypothetical protein